VASELTSYTIPNLIQGISRQADGQRDPSQAEEQVNGVSSLAEGLRKRDCTVALARVGDASDFDEVYFHQIQRDTLEQFLVAISKTAIKVFDLAGNEKRVAAKSGAYQYLSSVVDTRRDIRASTVVDYTFISNTKVTPAMDDATAPLVPRQRHEALVWVKAANYGQNYKVNVNGEQVEVETPVAAVVVEGDTTTLNRISTADIAEEIRDALVAELSAVAIARSGSVLHFTSLNPITIEATDARANADITAITGSVQAFTELPTIAPRGYQIQVVGDPGTQFDNYHVAFVPRTGDFGEGSWQETVAPGSRYKINPDTMPHVLVSLSDGTFYFGPLDGSTVTGLNRDLPRWGERTAGDSQTVPDPSFIGHPIQDVFIYKNRLGILADENIILSRAQNYFEFFAETVTGGVLDSDPIDLSASTDRVSILRYAIPYQDELIIFSEQIQFRFNSAEAILTPLSATITVLTQYEIDPNCRPILVQGTIIFCQTNGQWSQFREFSVRGAGTALVADASDLTSYLRGYIPAKVTRLAANDTSNCWFVITAKDGFRGRVYTFKYFYRNTGSGAERVQSSWSYWEMGKSAQVLQILCVEETLYLLIRRGRATEAKVWLEKISVADRLGSTISGSDYPVLLDRRISVNEPGYNSGDVPEALRIKGIAYDQASDRTTWQLPDDYVGPGEVEAWAIYEAPNVYEPLGTVNRKTNTIETDGNWKTAAIAFGEPYEFKYRFTRFKYYKEIGGGKAASNVYRTQVRYAKVRHSDTRSFTVWVKTTSRDWVSYKFNGPLLAGINSKAGNIIQVDPEEEGVFRFPVYGRGENSLVEIRDKTIHPCKFSTCEWVGLISAQVGSMK